MLEKGLTYKSRIEVDSASTACAMGSGDMAVYATPSMVALMENAAMLAVSEHLAEGETTVGTRLEIDHVKASAVGSRIEATALLTEVDGRRLTFEVEAYDEKGLIGKGTHTRFVVLREKFLAKL